jgi:hypothetical protein
VLEKIRKFFAPSRDNEVALEEVAAVRSRMRKLEAFLLLEVERLRMRMRILEVDRAVRAADEAEEKGPAPSKDASLVVTLDASDADKTPVERKKPRRP